MSTFPKKPNYTTLENGYIIPRMFEKEFERSTTYVPETGDVFICTYPKCGTTWTQNILYLMSTRGEPIPTGQQLCDVSPHLEDQGKDFVKNLPQPRIIKTHLPYAMLPKSKNAKYLFVARNPKDCCVSFYHHTRGFNKCYDYVDGKFDDYFKLFLAGEVDYGDYFDHLLGYHDHKEDLDMLCLLYEDMKEGTRDCITKIGRFLGGVFAEASQDPAVLDKVVHNSSFQVMRSKPSLWSSEQVAGSPGFVRKGEVGDWRNHFSEVQTKLMDEKFRTKLAGTKAEHLWEMYDC